MTAGSTDPADDRVELDGWTLVILATVFAKLALWPTVAEALAGLDPRLDGAGARTALVTVACHGIVWLLLAAGLTLAVRRLRARRGAALAVHAVLLFVGFFDFVYVARLEGVRLTYVQFGMWAEGIVSLWALAWYVRPTDLLVLVDLPVLAYGVLAAPCRPGPWRPRRWVRRAAWAAGSAYASLALFLAGTPGALLEACSHRYSQPVLWAANALLVLCRPGHYPQPAALPPGLPAPAGGDVAPDARPDVLLVQMESVQGGALEWECQGEPVMPYLRALADEGVVFANAVSTRRSGHSFDADLGVLSGFHPPPTSDPYRYRFAAGSYFPSLLARAGWRTWSFDNCDPDFFGTSSSHRALGIESAHTYTERTWSSRLVRLEHACPGDREFLGWVGERLGASPRPWFCLIKTISTHGPWWGFGDEPEVRATIGTPFRGEDRLSGYAAALRYGDRALRELLEPLLPRIRAKRLVVAIYGDHGTSLSLPRPPLPGCDRTVTRRLSVPLVVLGTREAPGRRDDVVSLHDLPVTVARLVGLRFAPGDLGGRDLFGPRPLPPLVTPGRVFDRGTVRPPRPQESALLEWGYGRLGASR